MALGTFGALAAVGLMSGLWLSLRTAERVGLPPDAVWDAGLVAVVAAFVVSRLLLVVENFQTFRVYPVLLLAVPSLTAWGLGLASLGTLGWLVWRRLPVLRVMDAWAPCGALVWGFLALGHFAEGSDPGMACAWGVRMPGSSVAEYPVGVLGAVLGVGLCAGLVWGLGRLRVGVVAGLGLFLVGLGQFGLGFLRQPGSGAGLDDLQWVAVGMMGVGGLVWVWAEDARG